jgi:hypothetical protein
MTRFDDVYSKTLAAIYSIKEFSFLRTYFVCVPHFFKLKKAIWLFFMIIS